MMTIVSPSGTSSVKPSSTTFGPNALWMSMSWITDGEGTRNQEPETRNRGSGRMRCRSPTTYTAARNRREPSARVRVRWTRERGRASPPGPVRVVLAGALGLGREAAEGAPDVALAEPLERAVAQLAHALARDAEHRADLLERVLAPALEAEVEAQHLGVARRERAERLLDLVGEEAVHRLLLGVGHLVGDEALDQRAVALGVHRRVAAHVAGVERGQRLHDVDRQAGELRELLGRRLAAQLLAQDLGGLDDARQVGRAVERDAHGAPLPRERREDGLAD